MSAPLKQTRCDVQGEPSSFPRTFAKRKVHLHWKYIIYNVWLLFILVCKVELGVETTLNVDHFLKNTIFFKSINHGVTGDWLRIEYLIPSIKADRSQRQWQLQGYRNKVEWEPKNILISLNNYYFIGFPARADGTSQLDGFGLHFTPSYYFLIQQDSTTT